MKKVAIWIVTVFLMAAFIAPTSLNAAKGHLFGIGIGAGFPSASSEFGSDFKTGGASYLDLGYGFNKYFEAGAYLGSGVGSEKSYDTSITWYQPYLGAYGRFTFPVGDSLEPYANNGLNKENQKKGRQA